MTTYTATITFKNISPEDVKHAQYVMDEETKYRRYKIKIGKCMQRLICDKCDGHNVYLEEDNTLPEPVKMSEFNQHKTTLENTQSVSVLKCNDCGFEIYL